MTALDVAYETSRLAALDEPKPCAATDVVSEFRLNNIDGARFEERETPCKTPARWIVWWVAPTNPGQMRGYVLMCDKHTEEAENGATLALRLKPPRTATMVSKEPL